MPAITLLPAVEWFKEYGEKRFLAQHLTPSIEALHLSGVDLTMAEASGCATTPLNLTAPVTGNYNDSTQCG